MKENFVKGHSDAVINNIATETDIEIQIHNHEQVFVMDCSSITRLNSLGKNLKSLLPLDWEMEHTGVAVGRKLTALGLYPIDLTSVRKILEQSSWYSKNLAK